jgi:hypothetical protein
MKVMKLSVIVSAVALVLTAANAPAQQILVSAAVKATSFDSSGGKIIKKTTSNTTIISDCTSAAGAQLVGLFDASTLELVELDVVDSCGITQCQIATFSLADDCVDTGVVNGKEELVCPVSMSLNGGGGGELLCDLKLSFDSMGAITGGKLKCTGVLVDGSGHPGTISITAGSVFKPGSGCAQ